MRLPFIYMTIFDLPLLSSRFFQKRLCFFLQISYCTIFFDVYIPAGIVIWYVLEEFFSTHFSKVWCLIKLVWHLQVNCGKKLFSGYFVLCHMVENKYNDVLKRLSRSTKLTEAEVFSVQFSLMTNQLKVFDGHFIKWTSINYLGIDLKNYSGNNSLKRTCLNLDEELHTAALIRIQDRSTLSSDNNVVTNMYHDTKSLI